MRKFETGMDRRRAKLETIVGEPFDNLSPDELKEERKLLRHIGKSAAVAGGLLVMACLIDGHGWAADSMTLAAGAFFLGESMDIRAGEAELGSELPAVEPLPESYEPAAEPLPLAA